MLTVDVKIYFTNNYEINVNDNICFFGVFVLQYSLAVVSRRESNTSNDNTELVSERIQSLVEPLIHQLASRQRRSES